MAYISEILKQDIELKLNYIKKNPEAQLKKGNIIQKDLSLLTDIYSWWLEFPEERRGILVFGETDKNKIKKQSKIGVKRVRDAWRYLLSLNTPISKNLNRYTVLTIGEKIDPNNDRFRNVRVTLNLPGYTPPNPIKIPELIDKLELKLEEMNKSKIHPVAQAAYVHLKLTSIQPFRDGNKRTARLFQNRILHEYGLPPATIHPGEREVYVNHLHKALIGESDGKIGLQRDFYDFIASKVNSNLDDIIGDLKTSS